MGNRGEELLCIGVRILFGDDEKALVMDGGNGGPATCVCPMPLKLHSATVRAAGEPAGGFPRRV